MLYPVPILVIVEQWKFQAEHLENRCYLKSENHVRLGATARWHEATTKWTRSRIRVVGVGSLSVQLFTQYGNNSEWDGSPSPKRDLTDLVSSVLHVQLGNNKNIPMNGIHLRPISAAWNKLNEVTGMCNLQSETITYGSIDEVLILSGICHWRNILLGFGSSLQTFWWGEADGMRSST